MRMIGLSETTDTVPQTIYELAGRYSLSEQFVASVELTMLDTQQCRALASDPGGQNAPHNAFFSRGIQRDLRTVCTRSSSHFAILQSRKAQAQSSKILNFARRTHDQRPRTSG